jgi:hypothetical protein
MAAVAAAGEAGHAPASHDVNQDALDTRNSEHALKTLKLGTGSCRCTAPDLPCAITCRIATYLNLPTLAAHPLLSVWCLRFAYLFFSRVLMSSCT